MCNITSMNDKIGRISTGENNPSQFSSTSSTSQSTRDPLFNQPEWVEGTIDDTSKWEYKTTRGNQAIDSTREKSSQKREIEPLRGSALSCQLSDLFGWSFTLSEMNECLCSFSNSFFSHLRNCVSNSDVDNVAQIAVPSPTLGQLRSKERDHETSHPNHPDARKSSTQKRASTRAPHRLRKENCVSRQSVLANSSNVQIDPGSRDPWRHNRLVSNDIETTASSISSNSVSGSISSNSVSVSISPNSVSGSISLNFIVKSTFAESRYQRAIPQFTSHRKEYRWSHGVWRHHEKRTRSRRWKSPRSNTKLGSRSLEITQQHGSKLTGDRKSWVSSKRRQSKENDSSELHEPDSVRHLAESLF